MRYCTQHFCKTVLMTAFQCYGVLHRSRGVLSVINILPENVLHPISMVERLAHLSPQSAPYRLPATLSVSVIRAQRCVVYRIKRQDNTPPLHEFPSWIPPSWMRANPDAARTCLPHFGQNRHEKTSQGGGVVCCVLCGKLHYGALCRRRWASRAEALKAAEELWLPGTCSRQFLHVCADVVGIGGV